MVRDTFALFKVCVKNFVLCRLLQLFDEVALRLLFGLRDLFIIIKVVRDVVVERLVSVSQQQRFGVHKTDQS